MGETAGNLSHLLDSIFHYGAFWVYATILVACFIENIFPPFPGDTFIVAGGGLVGMGRLDLVTTLIVVIAGGMTSVMIVYVFGRQYGREYFLRKNFRYFSAADVVRMESWLAKWGAVILVFSRFVVGARSAIAVAAGIGEYSQVKMFVYSLVSYIIFAGLLICASMQLVGNLPLIEEYFSLYNKIIWPILGVLALSYVVYKYLKVRKSS